MMTTSNFIHSQQGKMFSELHARTNNNDRVLGDVLDQVSEMTMKEENDTSSFTGNTRTTSTSTCTRTPSSTDATCRSSVTLDTAAILPSSPYKTPVNSCAQSLMMAMEEIPPIYAAMDVAGRGEPGSSTPCTETGYAAAAAAAQDGGFFSYRKQTPNSSGRNKCRDHSVYSGSNNSSSNNSLVPSLTRTAPPLPSSPDLSVGAELGKGILAPQFSPLSYRFQYVPSNSSTDNHHPMGATTRTSATRSLAARPRPLFHRSNNRTTSVAASSPSLLQKEAESFMLDFYQATTDRGDTLVVGSSPARRPPPPFTVSSAATVPARAPPPTPAVVGMAAVAGVQQPGTPSSSSLVLQQQQQQPPPPLLPWIGSPEHHPAACRRSSDANMTTQQEQQRGGGLLKMRAATAGTRNAIPYLG